MTAYALSVVVDAEPAVAEAAVRSALADEGFGILTEIDVAATMKAKLGVDRGFYKILGACNPTLANRALNADIAMGLLLPCNVVVYDDDGTTIVAAIEPATMSQLSDAPGVAEVADEARRSLLRALESVAS